MDCLVSACNEHRNPCGRNMHVQKELHPPATDTSCSSALQAAYSSAASIDKPNGDSCAANAGPTAHDVGVKNDSFRQFHCVPPGLYALG